MSVKEEKGSVIDRIMTLFASVILGIIALVVEALCGTNQPRTRESLGTESLTLLFSP